MRAKRCRTSDRNAPTFFQPGLSSWSMKTCRLLGVDRIRISEDDILAGYLGSSAYRAAALPPFDTGKR